MGLPNGVVARLYLVSDGMFLGGKKGGGREGREGGRLIGKIAMLERRRALTQAFSFSS